MPLTKCTVHFTLIPLRNTCANADRFQLSATGSVWSGSDGVNWRPHKWLYTPPAATGSVLTLRESCLRFYKRCFCFTTGRVEMKFGGVTSCCTKSNEYKKSWGWLVTIDWRLARLSVALVRVYIRLSERYRNNTMLSGRCLQAADYEQYRLLYNIVDC